MKNRKNLKILFFSLLIILTLGLRPCSALAKGQDSVVTEGTIRYYENSEDESKNNFKDNQKGNSNEEPKESKIDSGKKIPFKSILPQTGENNVPKNQLTFFGSVLILTSVLFFSKRKKFL